MSQNSLTHYVVEGHHKSPVQERVIIRECLVSEKALVVQNFKLSSKGASSSLARETVGYGGGWYQPEAFEREESE